jgi:hypothetical protein
MMPYATRAGWKGDNHKGIVTMIHVLRVIAISAKRDE